MKIKLYKIRIRWKWKDPKLRIIRKLKNPNNNRKKPKNLKKGLSLEPDDPNKKTE